MSSNGLRAARQWSTRAGAALLEGWRPDLVNLVRVTTAAVLAYVITRLVTVGPIDLTCSLTAILVTQASATGSLRMGMVRVGAVLTGMNKRIVDDAGFLAVGDFKDGEAKNLDKLEAAVG